MKPRTTPLGEKLWPIVIEPSELVETHCEPLSPGNVPALATATAWACAVALVAIGKPSKVGKVRRTRVRWKSETIADPEGEGRVELSGERAIPPAAPDCLAALRAQRLASEPHGNRKINSTRLRTVR